MTAVFYCIFLAIETSFLHFHTLFLFLECPTEVMAAGSKPELRKQARMTLGRELTGLTEGLDLGGVRRREGSNLSFVAHNHMRFI